MPHEGDGQIDLRADVSADVGIPLRNRGIKPDQLMERKPDQMMDRAAQQTARAKPQRQEEPSHASTDTEYARVPLLAPITLSNGSMCNEIIVYRPPCHVMTEVLDTVKLNVQIERFVSGCCKAMNGTGTPVAFDGGELSSIDASEFASIIGAMSNDADTMLVEESGDGITEPFLYTLKRPVQMGDETVRQFEFKARKISDISEYLDARGETREFHSFMRTFGKPIGLRFPLMSDALINALDFEDYLRIRRQVLPKFVTSRSRWKKASLNVQ